MPGERGAGPEPDLLWVLFGYAERKKGTEDPSQQCEQGWGWRKSREEDGKTSLARKDGWC